mgnify:CR=1 FL=1
MQPDTTATLATRYDEPCDERTDYAPFFDGLLAVAAGPLTDETGERIRNYVMGWLERHPLESFDRYSDRNYVRGEAQQRVVERLARGLQRRNELGGTRHELEAG